MRVATVETTAIGPCSKWPTLVAFTDGVTDSHNIDGALFGDARQRELMTAPADSAQAMVHRIQAAVRMHAGDVPAFDDVTLLVVRRTS